MAGFTPISENFLDNPLEFELGSGQSFDDFTLPDLITPGGVTLPPTLVHPLLIKLERGKLKLLGNNMLNPADSVRVAYTESATVSSVTTPGYIPPFPVNGVIDQFTYGAGGLGGDGDWSATPIGPFSNLHVGGNFANTVNPSAATCGNYTTTVYGPDCEAYYDIVQKDTTNPSFIARVQARINNPTLASSAGRTGYEVQVDSNGNWKIVVNNGSINITLATFTQAIANGDKVGIQCIGSQIYAWWYDGTTSLSWHMLESVTDTTVTTGGNLGITLQGGASTLWTVDNFGGGTIVGGADTAQFTESATITSVTSVQSAESYTPVANLYPTVTQALLIKLNRGKLKVLDNSILNPDVQIPYVAYTEAATVSSVTSVQSTESTDYLDTSGAVQGTSSIAITESTDYLDSATVGSVSSVSAVETAQFVDADTPSSVTSIYSQDQQIGAPTSTRPLLITLERGRLKLLSSNILSPSDSVRVAYTDFATVGSVTSVQSTESTDFLDTSGAVNGTSSISITESTDYVDSSTVAGVSSLSAVDVAAYIDAAIVSGVTSLSAVETTDYVDSATVGSITSIYSQDQQVGYPYLPRPLLITLNRGKLKVLDNAILNPADSQRVVYTDSATISSVTSLQSTESTDFVDTSGAVNGTSSIAITESTDYAESATVAGTTTPSSVDAAAYVDSTTVSGVTTPSAIETTDYVDSATVSSVTSLYSQDQQVGQAYSPRPLLIKFRHGLLRNNILNPADSVRVSYTDSATISGVTSVQAAESSDYLDTSGAVQGTSSVSFTESTDYAEANTIAGVTSLSTVDTTDYVDSTTVNGVTTPSLVDTTDYVDSATVAGVTSINLAEAQVGAFTAPQPLLIKFGFKLFKLLHNNLLIPTGHVAIEYDDSATISSVTSITYTETADYADAALPSNITTVLATDFAAYADQDSPSCSTSISDSDVAAYVDSDTASCTTSPSISESIGKSDSGTTSSITYISATDVAAYVDLNTAIGITTLSVSEQAAYIDAAITQSTTNVNSVDTYGRSDIGTVSTNTTCSIVDVAAFVDTNTAPGITSISIVEDYTPLVSDTATVTSITTIESFDIKVEVELYVVGNYLRWPSLFNGPRWSSSSTRRWNVVTNGPRYDAEGMKEWTAS